MRAVLTILFIAVLSIAGYSKCRDCAMRSVGVEFANAKAVFTGKLLKVTNTDDMKIYEFRVEKYWKGIKNKIVRISVSKTMRFEPFYETGKSYLIYAFTDEKGNFVTYKCSRGARIDFAKSELKALGKGKTIR